MPATERDEKPESIRAGHQEAVEEEASLKAPAILIIDDDGDFRETMVNVVKMLTRNRVGVQIDVASGLDEAKELLETSTYDVVFTDGLEGDWANVLALIDQEHTELSVVSSSDDVISAARSKKISAFSKDSADLLNVIEKELSRFAEE